MLPEGDGTLKCKSYRGICLLLSDWVYSSESLKDILCLSQGGRGQSEELIWDWGVPTWTATKLAEQPWVTVKSVHACRETLEREKGRR